MRCRQRQAKVPPAFDVTRRRSRQTSMVVSVHSGVRSHCVQTEVDHVKSLFAEGCGDLPFGSHFLGCPTVWARVIFRSGRSFIALAGNSRSIEARTTVASPSDVATLMSISCQFLADGAVRSGESGRLIPNAAHPGPPLLHAAESAVTQGFPGGHKACPYFHLPTIFRRGGPYARPISRLDSTALGKSPPL
jgi:hypothetical protein